MIRLGMTLGVREDKIDEYKKLHANVWPEILDNLTEPLWNNSKDKGKSVSIPLAPVAACVKVSLFDSSSSGL